MNNINFSRIRSTMNSRSREFESLNAIFLSQKKPSTRGTYREIKRDFSYSFFLHEVLCALFVFRFVCTVTHSEKFTKSISGPLVNGEIHDRVNVPDNPLWVSRLTPFILRVFTGWQRKRRHKGTLDTRVSTGEGRGWPDWVSVTGLALEGR